jgi:hypothetical protein
MSNGNVIYIPPEGSIVEWVFSATLWCLRWLLVRLRRKYYACTLLPSKDCDLHCSFIPPPPPPPLPGVFRSPWPVRGFCTSQFARPERWSAISCRLDLISKNATLRRQSLLIGLVAEIDKALTQDHTLQRQDVRVRRRDVPCHSCRS